MHDAVGFAHLLLQQFQLLPRTSICGRQDQIQIVGAGVDHTERLAQIVYKNAHNGPNPLLERIGGDVGSKCGHVM
ncbi:MAG: hypothetical protein ABSG65_04485 [Bryobacteraceae bacterium]|jgi:hypothetical protein